MHLTLTRKKINVLKNSIRKYEREVRLLSKIPEMRPAIRLRREEIDRLKKQIDDLESKARLEDLDVWKMEKIKGEKAYTYWLASWRESDKVHNVHLGSCRKMSRPEALKKAKKLKAEALGISL